MAVELQSYETANFPAGSNVDQSSWTVTKPSGLSVGDLIIIMAGIGDKARRNVSAPSGWERIYKMPLDVWDDSQGVTNCWWKIADASDVAASNFTITVSGGTNTMSLIAFRYTGHDPVAPFDQLEIRGDVRYNSGWGGQITAPALTSRVDGCCAIRSWWIWNNDCDLYDVGGQNTTTLLNSKNTDGYDTTFTVLIDGTSTSSLTEYDDGDSVPTKGMQVGCSGSWDYYTATLLIMPDQGRTLVQTVDAANAVTIDNGQESNGGTFTVNKPSGVSEDDLLVMVILAEDAGRTITSTGFTVLLNEDFSGESLHILYKIAGASEGGSYTVSNSGGTTSGFVGTLFSVSNVDTENPISATAITESTTDSDDKGNCPALTVGANGHLIVHVEAYDDDAAENSIKPARDYYILPYLEETQGDDAAIAVSYSQFPSSASAAYPQEAIWLLYDATQYIGYTFSIAPVPSTGGASFLLFVDS